MLSAKNLKELANTPITKKDEESPEGQYDAKMGAAAFWRQYYGYR